ncbi:MAG: hypothetical protein H7829_07585 [Magnetococcus sp. THC-1_WYH]
MKENRFRWVTIRKLSEITGYSENAIRGKIKTGVWLKDIHWTKAPDGRNLMDMEAIQRWVEGEQPLAG